MKVCKKSKFLALILSLAVIFSSLPFAALPASAVTADDDTTYKFDNQASKYTLGDNCEATTYNNNYSVNYTSTNSSPMQVKLAENTGIYLEYKNSSKQNNVIKTESTFLTADKKSFIINIPVETGDKVSVKYSAKGNTAAIANLKKVAIWKKRE